MTVILVVFACTSALALVLPWQVLRYLVVIYVLGVILIWLFLPPVHWSDQDWGYALAMAVLMALLLAVGIPLFLRLLWAVRCGQVNFSTRTRADVMLGGFAGAVLALLAFVHLSYLQAGSSVILAHGTALSIAIFAWLIRHPTARSFSLCFVALTFYSLSYPDIVRAAAVAQAPEGYTLLSPNPASSPSLTFLSMPKFPHPRLHFERDGRPMILGWSYRRRAFLPIWH